MKSHELPCNQPEILVRPPTGTSLKLPGGELICLQRSGNGRRRNVCIHLGSCAVLAVWQRNSGKHRKKPTENPWKTQFEWKIRHEICWICCNQRELGNPMSQILVPARVGCPKSPSNRAAVFMAHPHPWDMLGLQTATNGKRRATKQKQVHGETLPSS